MRHGADCQLCFEGASGMEIAVPLWLPIVGLEGHATQGEDGPQSIRLEPQLEFAIVAEMRLRLARYQARRAYVEFFRDEVLKEPAAAESRDKDGTR